MAGGGRFMEKKRNNSWLDNDFSTETKSLFKIIDISGSIVSWTIFIMTVKQGNYNL